MNTLCKYEKKIKVLFFLFLFIYLFVFLEYTRFVCNSVGNAPVVGAVSSILKHQKRFITQKHNLIFSGILQKMSSYYPRT